MPLCHSCSQLTPTESPTVERSCCLTFRLPLHPVLQLEGQQNCCLGTLLVSPVKEQQPRREWSSQALQLSSKPKPTAFLSTKLVAYRTSSKGVPAILPERPCQHMCLYKAAWHPGVKQRARQIKGSSLTSPSEGALLAARGEGKASPSSSVPGAM